MIAADGQAIGTVAALHFDRTSWTIQQVEVKLHRDIAKSIGEKPGMFHAATISVPTSLIQSIGDAVVLKVPTAELRSGIPQASSTDGWRPTERATAATGPGGCARPCSARTTGSSRPRA